MSVPVYIPHDDRLRRVLLTMRRCLLFFLFTTFIVTCCLILFLQTMMDALGVDLGEEYIGDAARLTFYNVVLLSLLFTALDALRRYLTVEQPVKRIVAASERIRRGDLAARVEPFRGFAAEGFNEVSQCFNDMAAELGSIETLRTGFVADVSHELKTPLAVIQNYGTLLQGPGLGEEERLDYARSVTDAARRLAALVTNILKLNKLENQQIVLARTRFDLGEQLCTCLLAYEGAWEDKGLDVEVDVAEDVYVEADEEMLGLVWSNLVSNAVKFTDPGGRIAVRLTAEGDHAAVSVADTGCGIAPEVGRRMFEKFYQGDTSHARQGNGLGLALVKRVVDMVGGEIAVQSEVGRGSVFTVRLRLAPGTAGAGRGAVGEIGKPKRDDEEVVR